MASMPNVLSTAEDPIRLFTEWLRINEPRWHLAIKDTGPSRWYKSFYQIHVGEFGWIDGPRTEDYFVVKVRRDVRNIDGSAVV